MALILNLLLILAIAIVLYPKWLPYLLNKLLKKKDFLIEMQEHFKISHLSFINKLSSAAPFFKQQLIYLKNVQIRVDKKSRR